MEEEAQGLREQLKEAQDALAASAAASAAAVSAAASAAAAAAAEAAAASISGAGSEGRADGDRSGGLRNVVYSRVGNFLYSGTVVGSSSSNNKVEENTPPRGPQISLRLLSLSHRCLVTRLQLWCENKLCKYVNVDQVSRILCQAHLHQAEKLEQFCLSFIKKNMAQVVTKPGWL